MDSDDTHYNFFKYWRLREIQLTPHGKIPIPHD